MSQGLLSPPPSHSSPTRAERVLLIKETTKLNPLLTDLTLGEYTPSQLLHFPTRPGGAPKILASLVTAAGHPSVCRWRFSGGVSCDCRQDSVYEVVTVQCPPREMGVRVATRRGPYRIPACAGTIVFLRIKPRDIPLHAFLSPLQNTEFVGGTWGRLPKMH